MILDIYNTVTIILMNAHKNKENLDVIKQNLSIFPLLLFAIMLTNMYICMLVAFNMYMCLCLYAHRILIIFHFVLGSFYVWRAIYNKILCAMSMDSFSPTHELGSVTFALWQQHMYAKTSDKQNTNHKKES